MVTPVPEVNETQGDNSYKWHVQGMRANGGTCISTCCIAMLSRHVVESNADDKEPETLSNGMLDSKVVIFFVFFVFNGFSEIVF